MKIVADENIPLVEDLFASMGSISLYPGRDIGAAQVQDADVLLLRSVTPVNEALLKGSSVRFVGTCTIGTDHLDTQYLQRENICFASAPGCNALAVVQYVLSAMVARELLDTANKVAIVGCGNVGGRIYQALRALGFDCIAIDPFKQAEQIHVGLSAEKPIRFREFQAIQQCDVVMLHTPYTTGGQYPSHHLINASVLARLKPGATLINAGRGGAVDNQALLAYLQAHDDLHVVLDVWENEPNIDGQLLHEVDLASPHIAGYSYEGRINGSCMIYQALASFLSHDLRLQEATLQALRARVFGVPVELPVKTLSDAIRASYDIREDNARIRRASGDISTNFDYLRKHYPVRREFSHYRIPSVQISPEQKRQFRALGFVVDD